ncbi:hypothetical protein [Pseudochrobactrum sp. XF203]|uniref:hypothetical protein n=1 Tax=Pseudochrobactrum sp. XF203 TaxID=2879116 RepID=UPI001CE2A220|nr:hypothetical protein [Pseudochrobactrum sp. XF203]UCA47339.1 hypothetical protein LDL70_08095 [Pseudochrobactrum sp. XF203]
MGSYWIGRCNFVDLFVLRVIADIQKKFQSVQITGAFKPGDFLCAVGFAGSCFFKGDISSIVAFLLFFGAIRACCHHIK